MKLNKKLLIVGGTGFIGSKLAKKTVEKGWKVFSISTNKPKKLRKVSKVKYLICDISKKRLLEKKIKTNFDYVVNLGGFVDHRNKVKTYNSHYIGCKNLAQIFLKKSIKSFIQIGSGLEYGNSSSPQKENNSCKPNSIRSIYGRSKLLSTLYLKKLYRKKKFPVTILRLYQAYGPEQDTNRFIPIIINGCIKNKKFACTEGKQFRDFIHVDDVIDSILKSLTNKKAKGEIFNIGTGKPKKIKNIIVEIKKIIKSGQPQYGKIKMRKDERLKMYPSIKKVRKLINWSPKISFKKGIKNTIKSYYE